MKSLIGRIEWQELIIRMIRETLSLKPLQNAKNGLTSVPALNGKSLITTRKTISLSLSACQATTFHLWSHLVLSITLSCKSLQRFMTQGTEQFTTAISKQPKLLRKSLPIPTWFTRRRKRCWWSHLVIWFWVIMCAECSMTLSVLMVDFSSLHSHPLLKKTNSDLLLKMLSELTVM